RAGSFAAIRFSLASSSKKPSLLGAMDTVFSCERDPLGRNCGHVDMSKLNSGFRRGKWLSTATILMVVRNQSRTVCGVERALSMTLTGPRLPRDGYPLDSPHHYRLWFHLRFARSLINSFVMRDLCYSSQVPPGLRCIQVASYGLCYAPVHRTHQEIPQGTAEINQTYPLRSQGTH